MVATAFWFALGIVIGIAMACMCRSCKVADLQRQVEAKKDAWCRDCPVNNRLSEKNKLIADREAYVRTLEDRCASLRESNNQLGIAVQRKSWRVTA